MMMINLKGQELTKKVKANQTKDSKSELSNSYTCKICKFEFRHKNDLKKHKALLHASDTSKMFVCNTCDFKLGSRKSLENHTKAQHLNEKHFSCNTCDYKSFYKPCVESHILSKHKGSKMSKVERIFCSQCSSGKEDDKDASHITDLQVSKCISCEFETKRKPYMTRHTKLMHGPNADVTNVLTCKTCEFETMKSNSLKDHINAQHLNQKRFSCNLCDFKSYYAQHVETHIKSRHKESKQAKLTKMDCSNCTLNIGHSSCIRPYKRGRKRTLQKMTSEKANAVSVKQKDRTCSECSYVAQKDIYLKRHIQLSHSQGGPSKIITCKICEFQSNKAATMRDHTNTIHHIWNQLKATRDELTEIAL